MIRIQNIYYMLAYAFQVLQQQGYRDIAAEEFENTADLCAAILIRGIYIQVKRGLVREYLPQTESLTMIRGKIDLTESVKTQSLLRKQMICSYDEFSENAYCNRILKTTVQLLLRSDVGKTRKKNLKKLLVYFQNVDTLNVHEINWNVHYSRNNQTYRMLIGVCWLVVKGLLQTQSDGTYRLMDFLDEQRMCRLYEKFILEYYRHHWPAISAEASQVPWVLDDGVNTLLPVMQSDISLRQDNTVLIIDAKYYSRSLQRQFDTATLHSSNLYQIFTYVKNRDAAFGDLPHRVSGMLLYAQTEADGPLNQVYQMSGNQISVKTLDLSLEFSEIRKQLDSIAAAHFSQ